MGIREDMNKVMGKLCQDYRKSINKTQADVSTDTEYSIENISGFENGRNNNLNIAMWYIYNGLPLESIVEAMEEFDEN